MCRRLAAVQHPRSPWQWRDGRGVIAGGSSCDDRTQSLRQRHTRVRAQSCTHTCMPKHTRTRASAHGTRHTLNPGTPTPRRSTRPSKYCWTPKRTPTSRTAQKRIVCTTSARPPCTMRKSLLDAHMQRVAGRTKRRIAAHDSVSRVGQRTGADLRHSLPLGVTLLACWMKILDFAVSVTLGTQCISLSHVCVAPMGQSRI
jgi:hypothetical protein